MLELGPPHPIQTQRIAAARGGFVWWYVDVRDEADDGFVLIWSLGLPFLPGSREEVPALSRPAVSVAHYQAGRPRLYLLQEYAEDSASLDVRTGTGRIGLSTYSAVDDDRATRVAVTLKEPMSGTSEQLQARLVLEGSRVPLAGAHTGVSQTEPHAQASEHVWTPRSLHARARVSLKYAGNEFDLEGSAYFDSNLSEVALHRQQMSSWRWGRIAFPDYTLVYYEVVEPDGSPLRYLFEQTVQGHFRQLTGRLEFLEQSRGRYGLLAPHGARILTRERQLSVRSTHVVEDGPFYQRAMTRATDDRGDVGYGVCEVVASTRVDNPWQRPFVRMRTHRVGRKNSPFLPLFNGCASDRAARLLSAWFSHEAAR